MVKLSKTQFSRAIEGSQAQPSQEASQMIDDGVEQDTIPRPPIRPVQKQSGRTSTVLLTVCLVVIGICAGWIGGILINNRSQSAAAAPPVDSPAVDPATAAQPRPESHPANRAGTEKSSTSSKSGSEEDQPIVTAESQAKQAETKEADAEETAKETPKDTAKKTAKETPPEVPRVEKGDEDKPDDPAKEVNRQALKELTKDGKKVKRGWGNRGWGNKNRNEDLQ